jgi:hypothetical protein
MTCRDLTSRVGSTTLWGKDIHALRAGSRCGGLFRALRGMLMVTVSGPDMLLTRREAAEVARVTVERIRTWERCGHLDRAGLDEDGRPVYRALDVAKAEYKLRGFTRVAA